MILEKMIGMANMTEEGPNIQNKQNKQKKKYPKVKENKAFLKQRLKSVN